jgi:DNA-binding transcriptional regulator GbsR (MarR family)
VDRQSRAGWGLHHPPSQIMLVTSGQAIDTLSVISYISVMTEITNISARTPEAVERFILHWGDMGAQWGVNRSVSQIQALLFLSDKPLTAEEIADQLQMARSNVSNSIKELLAWNLIRRVPIRNDRRDHFEAETDPWEMAQKIASGRKSREIDPALAALRSCVEAADSDREVSALARKRLSEMLAFMEQMDRFYSQMLSLPKAKRDLIFKLGAKIAAFLPGGK